MGRKGRLARRRVANTDPYCYLETIAPELLFLILVLLPDLGSLDNILQVSPASFRLFETRGMKIFEKILSNRITHKYTCALIHIIVLLRSSTFLLYVHDWASFQIFLLRETTPHRYKSSRWESTLLVLPLNVLARILRGVLVTSRKIQYLTYGCLQYYLRRFKALKPSHLANKSFEFNSDHTVQDGDYSHFVGPWQLKPAEVSFHIRDVGSTSWVEQQRTLRAFWRRELLNELVTDRSKLSWPIQDINRLSKVDIVDFYSVPPCVFQDEDGYSGDRIRDNEPEYMRNLDTLLEYELIRSATYYIQQCPETVDGPTYHQLKIENPPCYNWPTQEQWDTISRSPWSQTWDFFYQLRGPTGVHTAHTLSPLQHVQFEPYRHLGFAIWGDERMVGCGFLHPKEGAKAMSRQMFYASLRGTRSSYYTAWRSVLTADERSQVERVNKEWDDSIANSSTVQT